VLMQIKRHLDLCWIKSKALLKFKWVAQHEG